MSGSSWRSSGRRPAARAGRAPRPADSWSLSVARAREWWDDLAGGPPADGRYSELAAAAILSTALGLWADTSAMLASERTED